MIVKLYTDEGITGLGECCTLGPFYCGESQETVMGMIAGICSRRFWREPILLTLILSTTR